MKNNTLKNLKALQSEIKLSSKDRSEVGDFLMAKISEDSSTQRASIWLKLADHLLPANFELKPVAVFLIILLVFGAVFTSVGVSKNTLPGDALYPVKLTTENIKYNVFTKQENKSQYAMSLIENRIKELKEIVKNEENGERQAKIAQATQEIQENLDKVVKDIDVQETHKVVMAAQEVEEQLAAVQQEIEDMDVEEIKQKIQETSELLNSVVIEKITQQVQDIQNNENADDELKKIASEIEIYLEDNDYQDAVEKIVLMNSLIANGQEVKGDTDENQTTNTSTTEVADNNSQASSTQTASQIEPISVKELLGIEEEEESQEFMVELK